MSGPPEREEADMSDVMMRKKKVSDSSTEQVYIIRSQHINSYGRLFGGYLMQWMDEIAGVVARRHCETTITTASVDNLSFRHPAFQDDMVVLVGQVTYTGRTSMEICIRAYVEDYDKMRVCINKAYFVMVSIDRDGTPLEVPQLELVTDEERAEWESGRRRYELRKQRRIEGF